VEGIRQRLTDLGQQVQLVDRQRGFAAACPGGRAGDADDIAQVDLHPPGAPLLAQELDAP
jgi:hypothetical protein